VIRSASRWVAGRAVLVGDAAALVDPFLGEGVYYAVRSGQFAAEELAAACFEGRSTPADGYRRRIEAEIYAEFRAARKIAFSMGNSPILKAAIAGEDPNWGRVVMAVGKAGEPADRDRLAIWFGDIRVAVSGERVPDYSEERAAAYMKNPEIAITVDLGLGRGKDTVWTCDLTQDYIAINADYRS